ncbi:CBO0543 family protein [Bacillus sp. LL01]|uniref:CBO0543 family protein n=1 Tax=Bacillus sp. LL01 TaxID=1665556 RepID=UPI0018E2DCA2|nr:CBO0543 family protein [Bacillus sp. LL01]
MEIVNFDYLYSWIVQSSMAEPRWWLLFASIFFSWIIWWKAVDRSRLFEILSFGLFWAVMATWLDLLGTTYHMWSYPIKLIDHTTTLLPADVAVIPVMYMLLYQYASHWKSFVAGSIGIALVLSFIFEPLFVLLDMLDLKTWTHTKSFFSFFTLAIVTRVIFSFLQKAQKPFS